MQNGNAVSASVCRGIARGRVDPDIGGWEVCAVGCACFAGVDWKLHLLPNSDELCVDAGVSGEQRFKFNSIAQCNA